MNNPYEENPWEHDPDKVNCEGCETEEHRGHGEIKYHPWARNDAYGIYTGLYCEECYKGDKYPYRTDRYFDPSYAGECLEPEDY